jgi:DNA-directed RNA polymerase subunit beta
MSLYSQAANQAAEDRLLDYSDYPAVRDHWYSRILSSVSKAFPVENERYVLTVDNVHFDKDADVSPAAEKEAVLTGGSIQRRIRGDYVLTDKVTGQVVDRTSKTLLAVPALTSRGEVVRKGVRYAIPKQFRVRPGIYTRRAENGMLETNVNVKPGTGHNFQVEFDPDKNTFYYKLGGRRIPMVYLLKNMGIPEDEIKATMGKAFYDINSLVRPSPQAVGWIKKFNEKVAQEEEETIEEGPNGLEQHFLGMQLDPRTTQKTMGSEHPNVTRKTFMDIIQKILEVHHGGDTDDRDSLAYQSIHDFGDMVSEKITRDQNRVLRNALWKATHTGNLKHIPSGLLNKHMDHFFNQSGIPQAIEEINLLDSYNQNQRVVKLGEGGIRTVQQAPVESRGVQPSYLGYIDPTKAPESLRVGLDMYFAQNVRQGKDDQLLYTQFFNKDGERQWVSSEQASDSIIGFPEFKDSPHQYVMSVVNGKRMEYVPRDKVDFYVPSGDEMFSAASNFTPLKMGVKGMRLLMGSKYPSQALPLVDAEAPLVDTLITDTDGRPYNLSEMLGKYGGIITSPVNGTVEAVYKDKIKVRGDDGQTYMEPLYNNLPLARKTVVDSVVRVSAGDKVKKGGLLASSNFTDPSGRIAPGKNLSVAFMNYHGHPFEDAVVISEGAAKKLSHVSLQQESMEKHPDIEHNIKKFQTLFPSRFTEKQMKNMDAKGVVKPGTRVVAGDPLVLGVRTRVPELSSLGRRMTLPEEVTWEHDAPGIVTDVAETDKGYKVFVRTDEPMRESDKLTVRFGGKGVVATIVPDEDMIKDARGNPVDVIISRLTIPSRTNDSQVVAAQLGKIARKTGKPYSLPGFMGEDMMKFAKDELRKHNLKDTETVHDPTTGKDIPGIMTGVLYIMKTQQTAESKQKARSTDFYTAEGAPGRGGKHGSKHLGTLELQALLGHQAHNLIKDSKLVKGQNNDAFWRDVKAGRTPTVPETPFVYEKMKDMIRAAGVNYSENDDHDSIFAMTDADVKKLTAARKLENASTFSKDTLVGLSGGLFDPQLTDSQGRGRRWTYFETPEPILNPVMKEPIQKILGMTSKELDKMISGEVEYRGEKGGKALQQRLQDIDLDLEIKNAKKEVAEGPQSGRDKAIKKYRYLISMKDRGTHPQDFMLTRIPVLPPVFRPIQKFKDMTLVNDMNHMYRDMYNAMQDFQEAQTADVPADVVSEARKTMYDTFASLVGLMDPLRTKLKEKNVGGVLQQLFGKGSGKDSMVARKVIETNVDMAGLGVVAPDPSLKLNQIGMPIKHAWEVYEPFIIRDMVRSGMPATMAAKEVERKSRRARASLDKVVAQRPVVLNRAPSLHKYSSMAFWPKLVEGNRLLVPSQSVSPFGMDFDGDTASYTVPVTKAAVDDAINKMMVDKNLLSESSGKPLYTPSQEYSEGLYFMSKGPRGDKPVRFKTVQDMKAAYRRGDISVDTPVVIG